VVLLANPWHGFDEAFRKLTAPLPPVESAFRVSYPTALAWWGAGGDDVLGRALATTFAAYLRKSKGGRGSLPPLAEADGPSVLQARAIGRLLVTDELADAESALTPRGRFVLRVGGGSEGRLLLRALETGDVAPEQRAELLAALSEGPLEGSGVLPVVRAAHAALVEVERRCGALLTAPLQLARSGDVWRRRAAAADLLERARRAARDTGVLAGLLEWSGLEGDES
jgi:hypothetical protein